MELKRLTRIRAVDEVHDVVRDAILNHVFKPGERLDVDELAKKLGVSLTPIRTAMQMLTTEGLVETRPRSGTFVAMLSRRDVEETFDIRLALELAAIEKGAERIGSRELTRLKELLRRAAKTEAGRQQHDEANQELHRILVRASGNNRLMEIYESLNAHIQIARLHAVRNDWRGRLNEERQEHEQIVKALERRDLPATMRVLRKHIDGAKRALIQQLEANEASRSDTASAEDHPLWAKRV
ncbi:MAG TPA: GntR family transcriptional regulator [Bryobacteraceae bacterium]